jgi:hypothetical protein
MTQDDDFEQREASTRAFLRTQAQRAIDVRSKDREFHGLEREFLYHQAKMLLDYKQTRDLKHPRDLGNARENILRNFLRDSGSLPKRYAVSDRSARVVSTSGHISNEIDIALYDPMDSVTLMKRQGVYEVHPIESVYGVIQVKSNLTKAELRSGLDNLASFKKLDRPPTNRSGFIRGQPPSERGFALLFAFVSDLAWKDISRELEMFAKVSPSRTWPNAVFILDRGSFLFGGPDGAHSSNEGIEAIQDLQMHGHPDREGLCLYQFQSQLLALLRQTAVYPAQLDPYYHLPLVAEERSYAFTMGMFAEVGHCARHGDFARKISPQALRTLTDRCRSTAPINWIKAMNTAYGLPDDEEAYRRQPCDVRIYNPDTRPLSEILLINGVSLAYDSIDIAGMRILLPYYYAAKESLIEGCPKCAKLANPRQRQAKTKKSA